MANQWFRMYAEFATDPKVQMMSEADQRRFIMVLCMYCSCNDDVTLQDDEIAFQLRISNEQWSATKAVFIAKNLLNEDNRPAAWDKRQFVSDSSSERVARHRQAKKQGCNVTVTPPDTDTDISTTDVVDKRRAPRFDAQAHLVGIGVDATIAADWLQHRKAKKATVTLTVIDGIKGEAAKARISLSGALAMCCQRGWTGFKAEWMRDSDQDHGARNQQPARPTIHDERAYTAAALTGKIPARTTFEEFMAAKIPAASAGMKLIEGEVIHAA